MYEVMLGALVDPLLNIATFNQCKANETNDTALTWSRELLSI